jgi:hypothetical protein
MARNETRYMESVIAVAEELNFTLAAQKIHISQPMVSRNVAELEAKLGGRLFERDRKKVQLNKAGRAYVEQARIALLYGDRAFEAARAAIQDADVILQIYCRAHWTCWFCGRCFMALLMATRSGSTSSKRRMISCKCSTVRSIRRYIVWKKEDGYLPNGRLRQTRTGNSNITD